MPQSADSLPKIAWLLLALASVCDFELKFKCVMWWHVLSSCLSCRVWSGEFRHTGGAGEKGHLQICWGSEQQTVSGDGIQWLRDYTEPQFQVSSSPDSLTWSPSSSLTSCMVSRYRFPLDSEALVELWPTDCSSPECLDYVSQLDDFALDLQLMSCAGSS